MRPVTVVHGYEGEALLMTREGGEHHVAGIQGMDVVRREGVALLHLVGYPVWC